MTRSRTFEKPSLLSRHCSQEKTTDVNPVSQELEQTWAKSRVNLKGLEAHRDVIAAQKTHLQDQLSKLEKQTADYDALQSQVTEDQRNYDLYAQKRDQAQIDEAMDKERFLNVAIADAPSASMVAIQPRPKLYLALGLLTAVILSVGSSLLAEMSATLSIRQPSWRGRSGCQHWPPCPKGDSFTCFRIPNNSPSEPG